MSNFLTAFSGRSRLPLWPLLAVVFALGLGVRVYDLTDPPLDFHPTRQLRMAMIARGIYYKATPVIDPDVRDVAISFARSMGTYEPPILENLVALAYRLLGGIHLWASRIITSSFWLIGGVALFDLSRRMTSVGGAIGSLLYYLFLPFSVIASRSFQPDPGMVMWVILSVCAWYRWVEARNWRWAIAAGLTAGMAVLVKVVSGYLVIGVAIAAVIYALGLTKGLKNIQVWMMALLMALPGLAYYAFVLESRSSDYFLNWTVALLPLLLDPAFYVRWLIHVGDLIGLTILFIALAGLLISRPVNRSILLGLWVGYGVYGLTLPYQITTHSYYHLQLVPIVALSLAPVAALLVDRLAAQNAVWKFSSGGLVIAFLAFSVWTSIYQLDANDFRNAPAEWEKISDAIPSNGKTIALTQDYGYPLMYFGLKKVSLWPDNAERNLASLRGKGGEDVMLEFRDRSKGKSYFLITDFDQFEDQPALKELLYTDYPIHSQGAGYIIFDLEPSQPPDS